MSIKIDMKTPNKNTMGAIFRAIGDDIEISGNKFVGITVVVTYYTDEKPKDKPKEDAKPKEDEPKP